MANFKNVIAFVHSKDMNALVAPAAFSRLDALGDWLPDAMSSYYLECRLAGSNQVDLMGCVRASLGGREGLKCHLLQNDRLQGLPIWKSVTNLCTDWSTPGSSLHELIPHLWLSFDLDDTSWANPAPCLLICLDQSRFIAAHGERSSMLTARELRLLNDSIFELVLGRRSTSLETAALESCRDALFLGEQLAHMSMMLTRNPVARKIDISMPARAVLPYLARINWPGSISSLSGLMSRFCPDYKSVGFQLAVGESVAPTIELELHFDHSSESQERYCLLLDRLCDSRFCTKEQQDALLRWPGHTRLRSPGEQWPTRWRTWTDMKIVQMPSCTLSAKAYLGLSPGSSIF
ncbi:MAG: hypothetical protein ACLQAT_11580 [Candidatus Binataceae bacterium]